MLLTVLLFFRRRQQIVLGIIVNHGLGQNLVITGISGGCTKSFVHKSGDLVHI